MKDHVKARPSRDKGGMPRVGLTRAEAAIAMGVSQRTVDMLIAGRRGNHFPVAYIGRKPIIPIQKLEDWLSRQVQQNGDRP